MSDMNDEIGQKMKNLLASKKEKNEALTKKNAQKMCGEGGNWEHFIGFINDETNELVHLVGFETPPKVPDVVHTCKELKTDEDFGLEPAFVDTLRVRIFSFPE